MNPADGQNVLRLSEIFGPTFQGEGPSLGRLAMFARLMGCNLDCTWCDTPYTWDRTHFDLEADTHALTVEDTAQRLLAANAPLVVITGGEPLLQSQGILALTQHLVEHGRRVEIETNGTITPPPELMDLAWWNVSPKLAHSTVRDTIRIKPRVVAAFAASGRAVFKFVARDNGDLDEVTGLVDAHGLPTESVWVMPEGTNTTSTVDHMRTLADEILARGYSLSPRLHVLLWEDTRGR